MSKAEKRLKKLKERMDENAQINQRTDWHCFHTVFNENVGKFVNKFVNKPLGKKK